MPKRTPKPKSQPKKLPIVLIVIGGVVGVIVIVLIIWVLRNTGFLTRSVPQAELNKNNLNPTGSAIMLSPKTVSDQTVYAPEDMNVSLYAESIPTARFMSFGPDDTLYVGTTGNGAVYAVRDSDGNGQADAYNQVRGGLSSPHSVFYYKGDLYVGEERQVSVHRGITPQGKYARRDILIPDLPTGNRLRGGGHKTRTVAVGPDEKLYVSIGSSCNVCIEDDSRRATIMRFNLDGTGGEIYATGLRNTVGFDFDATGQLYGADMGRDLIGDDIPPEEVNKIVQGKNYGWPYCYGNKINNKEYSDKAQYCREQTEGPVFEMQAHSAPLGMLFMKQQAAAAWPTQYRNGYFVALHGSWNRIVPTGYKVIWVDTSSGQPQQYNFLSGFLQRNAEAFGRPVGLALDSKGALYVSDDKQGKIYKVTPKSRN